MNKKNTRALASATVLSLVLTTAVTTANVKAAKGEATRLPGANRYETAANVATANWEKSDKVILASGEGYADSLSASVLSKKLDAPIVLTESKELSKDAEAAIKKLGAKEVYVIGGEASVSEATRKQLKDSGKKLVELKGNSRFETNLAVANYLADDLKVDASNVIVVNGNDGFSDALSVAPVAAAKEQILLIVSKNPSDAKLAADFIKDHKSKATVVGTENVVPKEVYDLVNGKERVKGGENRFETNLNILNHFGIKGDKLYAANATGKGYADALVGSAVAGKYGAPLVLTDTKDSKDTANAVKYIKEHATKDTDLQVLGGEGVMPKEVVDAINDAVKPEKPVVKDLAVESVEAMNATQVKVKFNKAVDKSDATVDKVSIEGVSFSKADLSKDGKSLILTATKNIDVKNATVVVNPIKEKDDPSVKSKKYVSLITYKDEVAPTIVNVEAKTNKKIAEKITVKVSEPIEANKGLVKVDGEYATAKIDGSDEITVSGLSLDASKSHEVELINVEDLAGNKTVSKSANFTINVDDKAPVATLSAKSDEGDKAILVTFDKSMDKESVKAGLTVKNESLDAVSTNDVKVVENTDNKQFVIPVTSKLYTDKDSRTLNVIIKDTIKDSLGNKMVATVQKVTLKKDTVKPVATGYNVLKEDGKVKAIEVNFSEGLKAKGSVAFGSVVNESGVLDGTTFDEFASKAIEDGDKKVVFETENPKEINGKYAVSFAKDLVTDLSEKENKTDAFNYTIDFGKSDKDGIFELSKVEPLANNKIKVTFPGAVKGGAVDGSATDLANYTLAGKPLPAGTIITLNQDAQNEATITLPNESIEKDDKAAIFTVSNIKNLAGTKTLKTYTGTVDVKDNVAPQLISAKVEDNKTIILTYDEDMDTLDNAKVGKEFAIKQGDKEVTLADKDLVAKSSSGVKNQIKLTIDNGVKEEAKLGKVEINNLTISGTASKDGEIKVKFNDGTIDSDKTVEVKNGDNASTIVTKIVTEFTKDTDFAKKYTVTPDGAKVKFEAKEVGVKDVEISLEDKSKVGVAGALNKAQAGEDSKKATETEGTTLDLTKDLTIKALVDGTSGNIDMKDASVLKNVQKASDKAITITVK